MGWCIKCGSVVRESPSNLEGCDYEWWCANVRCTHHTGFAGGDQQVPEWLLSNTDELARAYVAQTKIANGLQKRVIELEDPGKSEIAQAISDMKKHLTELYAYPPADIQLMAERQDEIDRTKHSIKEMRKLL